MSDGDTKDFPIEKWKVDTSTESALKHLDPDYAIGVGASKFVSAGPLRAERRGNKIHIDWPITHTLNDTYDFHEGISLARGALALQESRTARPFEIQSRWNQRLVGTVDIANGKHVNNGKLVNPQLRWIDE